MLTLILILILNFGFSTKIIFHDDHHHISDTKIRDSLKLQNNKILRHKTEEYRDSELGNFRVHFFISGEDAVELTDIDNNGTPDYVDSALIYLEHSYDIIVNQEKWKKPISDLNNGGDNGGSAAIDVYFVDLSTSRYYGVATPETIQSEGANSGFLVLDNNYTDQLYNTKSFDALKVTLAHEFHHLVQFAYSTSNPPTIVLEMISTYIEEVCFPGVMDMRFYVDSLFRSPISSQISEGDFTYGYMYNIYFHYIKLKYNSQVVIDLWEVLIGRNNTHFLNTWDEYLKENHNTTIGDSFKEFFEWCYFSGERAIEGQYFPFANRFTTLRPNLSEKFSEPSVSDSKNLLPMGFNMLRVEYLSRETGKTNDTIDVLITNISTDKLSINPRSDTYYFATYSQNLQNSVKLNKIDFYIDLREQNLFDYNIKEYPGTKPETIASPYPSPFNVQNNRELIIPVGENQSAYNRIELQILNSNMESIFNDKLFVEIINNKKVVKFDNTNILNSSGVYFYTIKNNEQSIYGKFAVTK